MPVITVALFALAGVVLAVAIVIQQMAGGDDDPGNTPANQLAVDATNTVEAANATATAGASGGGTTPGTAGTTTPGTPDAGTTPGTTPDAGSTPGAGENTYTVQAGDFCATIAETAGISIDEFLELNPEIDADCTNLSVGQVVNIAP